MEMAEYMRFVFAFAFVIALIGLLAFLAKRYGMGYRHIPGSPRRRLSISEIMPLDSKRRLVLVRRDNREHLLVIGGTTDLVVESNINTDGLDFSDLLNQKDTPPSTTAKDPS